MNQLALLSLMVAGFIRKIVGIHMTHPRQSERRRNTLCHDNEEICFEEKGKTPSSKCVNMFANFKHNILELIYPDITHFYKKIILNTNTAFISKFYIFDSKGRTILKSSTKTKCKFGSLDSETHYTHTGTLAIPLQLNVITDHCYKTFCSLING